jgi:hypothetical protein
MQKLVVVLLLGAAGCSSAGVGAGSPTPSRPICPVTTPPQVAITPPPTAGVGPNPTLTFRAGQGTFLFGNDALIVLLPNDGTFHPSDPRRGLPGGIKLGWWRVAHGDLTIATQRLDAASVPLPADVPTGYGDIGFQATGVKFPAAGCWQVVGSVGGKTLKFVVAVAPQ